MAKNAVAAPGALVERALERRSHTRAKALPAMAENLSRSTALEKAISDYRAKPLSKVNPVLAMRETLVEAFKCRQYDQFRPEVIKMAQGKETDTMFLAAIDIFWKESGQVSNNAGRMAQDLISHVSEDTISRKLVHTNTSQLMTTTQKSKLDGTAKILGLMCRKVEDSAKTTVGRIMANMESLAFNSEQDSVKAAGETFLAIMHPATVDAVA